MSAQNEPQGNGATGMSTEAGIAVSEMVALAEKWAGELGCATERTEGRRTDGSIVPSVSIQHGATWLLCNEKSGVLRLLAVMDVAPETRAALRRLDANQNHQFLRTLRLELMQNPRGGFSVYPGEFRHAAEIQQISIEQRCRIAAGDLASYNRFIDAMQELSIGALRLALLFEPSYSTR
jgi:hypothetical protein